MPKLKDITPPHLRCTVSACPAAFKAEGNKLVIIGKRVTAADHPELAGRVGEGEEAIFVSAELIEGAVQKK